MRGTSDVDPRAHACRGRSGCSLIVACTAFVLADVSPAHANRPTPEDRGRPSATATANGGVADPAVADGSSDGAEAPSAAVRERAERLNLAGKRAYREGRDEDALRALQQAWALHKAPRFAANLALIELRTGRFLEAVQHFTYAIEHAPPDITPQQRASIVEGLAEAKQHVSTLVLQVEPEGAEVLLDGQVVGVAPISSEVHVQPGSHVIAARLGAVEETITIQSAANTTVRRTLRLRPPEETQPTRPKLLYEARHDTAVGAPVRRAATPTVQGRERQRWIDRVYARERQGTILIVGGGVTLAALGAGVAFLRAGDDARQPGSYDAAAGVSYATAAAAGAVTTVLLLQDVEAPKDGVRVGWPTFLGVELAVLGGLSGGFFLWQSHLNGQDAATEQSKRGSAGSCEKDWSARCAQIQQDLLDEKLFRDLAIASFVVAGAGAAGAVAHTIMQANDDARRASAGVGEVSLHSDGRQLILRGEF